MAVRDGAFYASLKDARARAIADTHVDNSPDEISARAGGYIAEKLVTLTGAGAPTVTNLFLVTGGVRVFKLYGIFEDVTNVADIDAVHLECWDGTNEVALTTGETCDTAALKSLLLKSDDATVATVFLNADEVRIDEATKFAILSAVTINANNGAATYIRMSHTNADTNLNCQIRWYCEWVHLASHDDGSVTPV